jgi:hypothetical protein
MSEPEKELPNSSAPPECPIGLYIVGAMFGILIGMPVGCFCNTTSSTFAAFGEALYGTLFGFISGGIGGFLIVWVVCKLVKD